MITQSESQKFPPTKNKTVVLVGTGYAWEACTFGNPSKDYWALNNMYEAGVKADTFDEWFQIHRPNSGEGHVDDAAMRQFLQTWEKPLWTQKIWGDEMFIKNPWVYPIDEVIENFCPVDAYGKPYPYFSNTVDYMICLAMLREYEEIQLFGIEFVSNQDEEYFKMRQSVNFYIARALERGIKVLIQPHSSLLKNDYWYGYESPRRDPFEKMIEENLGKAKGEIGKVEQQMGELSNALQQLVGGKQVLEQLIKVLKLRSKGCQI